MLKSKKQLFTKDISHSLKGVMALIIIASHLSLCGTLSHPVLSIANKLATSMVAMFFFISGYGLTKILTKKQNDNLWLFFYKRSVNILKTLLYITLAFLCINYFLSGSFPSDMLWGLVRHGHTPLPNSWFIFVLIGLFACYYISLKINKLWGDYYLYDVSPFNRSYPYSHLPPLWQRVVGYHISFCHGNTLLHIRNSFYQTFFLRPLSCHMPDDYRHNPLLKERVSIPFGIYSHHTLRRDDDIPLGVSSAQSCIYFSRGYLIRNLFNSWHTHHFFSQQQYLYR